MAFLTAWVADVDGGARVNVVKYVEEDDGYFTAPDGVRWNTYALNGEGEWVPYQGFDIIPAAVFVEGAEATTW